jgi:hypothetical protein
MWYSARLQAQAALVVRYQGAKDLWSLVPPLHVGGVFIEMLQKAGSAQVSHYPIRNSTAFSEPYVRYLRL